jgi:hypothetical protein
MTTDDKVRVIIEAVDNATSTLRSVSADLGKMSGSATTASHSIASLSSLTGSMKGRIIEMAAGFGIATTATDILSRAVRAVIASINQMFEAERAATRLEIAFRSFGTGSEKATEEAQRFAVSLGLVTSHEDDAIVAGMALLVNIGRLRGEALERATRAALDLADATDSNLESAFLAVARAAAGNTTALNRFIGKMEDGEGAAMSFSEALTKIESHMGGAAEAVGQSLEGAWTRLGNAMLNAGEAAAAFVLQNQPVKAAVNQAADAINAVLFGPKVPKAGTPRLLDETKISIDEAQRRFEEASKAGTVFGQVLEGVTVKTDAAQVSIVGVGESLKKLEVFIPTLDDLLSERDEDAKKSAEALEEYKKQLEEIALEGKSFTTTLEDLVALSDQGFDAGTLEPYIESLQILGKHMEDEVISKWDEFRTSMLHTLQEEGAGAAADFGATFVDAAFGADVAWGQFFKNLMRSLAAAIVRALIFRAIMTAISGGGGSALGASSSTGVVPLQLQTGPIPEAAPLRAPANGATIAIRNEWLGVSRKFVEEIVERQSDLARRYGLQILSTGSLGA